MICVRTEEIRIMEREELISAVIEKHQRLIAEYTAEYDALKNTSVTLDTEIGELKKRIEESEEKKTVIYNEKKHHSGYEAVEELKKMELKQIEAEKIEKGISELTSDKISDSADERKAVYETLRDDVNRIEGADVSSLLEKIDAAFEAYKEENRLIETIGADETLLKQKEGEVQEDKRAGWLEKRIGSHNESLEYWNGMK